MQQRQQQFMNIKTIVEDTAEHIVLGMKNAIPSHEWNSQHDTIVKGVLKQRDHIVQAFTEESFLEISRKNGIKKVSVDDKAKLFRNMLHKFDAHAILVELASERQHKDDTISNSITHIAEMWASFRRVMVDLAEFMYNHVAKETFVGVGVEGYIGWKGALSSGMGPNLQFCWDATDIFNFMVYGDDEEKYNDVMREYNDKRASDEVVVHSKGSDFIMLEESEGSRNPDATSLIKDRRYVKRSMRYALKGDINTKLDSNLGDEGKQGRKDMNKILGSASKSLKIKKGGESAITLWDTLTSSIRKAAKNVGDKVKRGLKKGKDIGLMCGKEKGLHVKVCINLNWRFPQPRPSPYLTLVLNRDLIRCLSNEGGHAMTNEARKLHPTVNATINWVINEMRFASEAMGGFFRSLPTLVDKTHHNTLKKLRLNEQDEEKKKRSEKLLKHVTARDHHKNEKRDTYLAGVLKKSKERHAKYLSDKKCDNSFQWVFGLAPKPGKPAGIRYSARDCLHAINERMSGLGDLLRSGTNAFQNMLNIPSSAPETKLMESDMKKDSSLLSKSFTHKSCNHVDIEHELTVTLAAGVIKQAFKLFTYSAVGQSLVNGPNKKARDKEYNHIDFVKDELLSSNVLGYKKKKSRNEYVTRLGEKGDDLKLIELLSKSKNARGKVPAAKIAKLRKLAKLKKFFLGMLPDGIGLGTTISIGPMHAAVPCIKHGFKRFLVNLFTSVTVGSCNKKCEFDADCNGKGECAALPSYLLFGDDQKRCLNCKDTGNICEMDSDCSSGVCDGGYLYGLLKGKCFKPLPDGGTCDADEQCESGDCDGHGLGLFWGKCDARGSDIPSVKSIKAAVFKK